jgi:3-hydroxyisobutyrate dehydrogenase-like beta-hydroxyacid dehydrogenase
MRPSVTAMTTIASLGLGRMGAAVAGRLLAAGHEVHVWNRTPDRAAPLVAAGARAAPTPAAAVRGAGVVIIMLTDAAAVTAVLSGPDGAEAGLAPGACLVQMSTIGPDEVRDLARRRPGLVDAPVAGSVAEAAAGELIILAGGPDEAIDRAAPVLTALGTVRRCGGVGAGSALKLVLNTALVTAVAALADALAVADAAGVDRAAALDALAAGPLGGAVGRATATGASFPVALAAKDLGLARRQLGPAAAPLADAAALALAQVPDQSADLAALVTKTREGVARP